MDLLVIGGIIYENSTSFPKSKIRNPKSKITNQDLRLVRPYIKSRKSLILDLSTSNFLSSSGLITNVSFTCFSKGCIGGI